MSKNPYEYVFFPYDEQPILEHNVFFHNTFYVIKAIYRKIIFLKQKHLEVRLPKSI